MRATKRKTATAARRASRSARKTLKSRRPAAVKLAEKPALRPAHPVPEMALFRVCRAPWAVIVERTANAQGTRFVCPFCPLSHRVPGPVRGFRKLRKAQWVKLRRVSE